MKRLGALFLCFALFASLVGCGKKAGGESFGFVLSAEPKQIDPQAISDTASLAVISAASFSFGPLWRQEPRTRRAR